MSCAFTSVRLRLGMAVLGTLLLSGCALLSSASEVLVGEGNLPPVEQHFRLSLDFINLNLEASTRSTLDKLHDSLTDEDRRSGTNSSGSGSTAEWLRRSGVPSGVPWRP